VDKVNFPLGPISDDRLPTHDGNEIGRHIDVLVDLRNRLRQKCDVLRARLWSCAPQHKRRCEEILQAARQLEQRAAEVILQVSTKGHA